MPWKSTILSAATLHVRSSNAIVLDQVLSECSPPPRLTRLRPKAVNGYRKTNASGKSATSKLTRRVRIFLLDANVEVISGQLPSLRLTPSLLGIANNLAGIDGCRDSC